MLFGSAAKGGFSPETSDVDLFLVLPDGATAEDRHALRERAAALEIAHGFRARPQRSRNRLEKYVERAVGDAGSAFVCTRSDLLSGDVARIFGLRPVEGSFVDRIVLLSVMVSAVTAWGEDLLPRVPLLPLRRRDVFKALFSFVGVVSICAVWFPLLPDATRYAAATLKHSLHSCYFCFHLRNASLDEEVAFFRSRWGRADAFQDLLEQRRRPARSYAFVWRVIPALFRLHFGTAWENRFPQVAARDDAARV